MRTVKCKWYEWWARIRSGLCQRSFEPIICALCPPSRVSTARCSSVAHPLRDAPPSRVSTARSVFFLFLMFHFSFFTFLFCFLFLFSFSFCFRFFFSNFLWKLLLIFSEVLPWFWIVWNFSQNNFNSETKKVFDGTKERSIEKSFFRARSGLHKTEKTNWILKSFDRGKGKIRVCFAAKLKPSGYLNSPHWTGCHFKTLRRPHLVFTKLIEFCFYWLLRETKAL